MENLKRGISLYRRHTRSADNRAIEQRSKLIGWGAKCVPPNKNTDGNDMNRPERDAPGASKWYGGAFCWRLNLQLSFTIHGKASLDDPRP